MYIAFPILILVARISPISAQTLAYSLAIVHKPTCLSKHADYCDW